MSGWIADHRKELESNIWLMPPMYHRVWQWLKYSVNHKEAKIPNKDGNFTTILPGQRATSYRQIAKSVGYYEGRKWKEPNVKTVKSILDWLVKEKMISVWGNTLGTIVTIENWSLYQEKEIEGNTKRITPSTPSKHYLDTNNNDITMNNNDKQKNTLVKDVIDHLNAVTNKQYKHTSQKTAACIIARVNEGFKELTQYKYVIDVKASQWMGTDSEKYLRPETLFGPKFEGYLNEKPAIKMKVTNELKGALGSPNPTKRVAEW